MGSERLIHNENFVRDAILIVMAAIAVSAPIYFWGVPRGNDMPQHFQFALQFESSLSKGALYPGWASEANGGLGDVGVRFYPPLPYYSLVFFKTLTTTWYEGSVLAFAFWFCLGGFGVYFLSREWLDGGASVLAAIVFTWLPYHVNQIYNAFFYAEFAGTAVLPFCFLFVARVVKRCDLLSILGLAAALAVLVLTHLPTAVMGSVALGVYAIAELWENRSLRSFLALGAGGLLGAAASSFYWIKLVAELNYVNHSTPEFTKTTFDFHSNFLAAYFYVGADDYISRSLWFADLIFLITLGLIVCSILVRRLARSNDSSDFRPLCFVAASSVFLATPLSWLIWQNFGLLQKIQFPFRFLSVISLCAAVLVAASAGCFVRLAATKYRPFVIISGGLLVATIVFSFAQVIRPALFTTRTEFDAMMTDHAAAKSCECWWPVWAKPAALQTPEGVDGLQTREIKARINGTEHSKVLFTVPDGTSVINVFYYPHWRLFDSGQSIDIQPDEQGRISFSQGSVSKNLELVFVEPVYVRLAQIVSIAGGLALVLLPIFNLVSSSRRREHFETP
ncbi:MAG: 6-pyruvoyl-tetrahydropterin synthase-related protein [Pyrinomonadaceae bacterium]